MEYARVFLLSALFLVAFMLWNAWETENGNKTALPVSTTGQPAIHAAVPVAAIATANTAASVPGTPLLPSTKLIQVHTDVLNVTINPHGGNIVQADLLKYPETLHSQTPYPLLNNDPAKLYVTQSGLIGTGGPDTPQQQTNYSVSQQSYTLQPGQKDLVVKLEWRSPQGVVIDKEFTFTRNQYEIGVNYIISNQSEKNWSGQFYAQLQRKKMPKPSRGLFMLNPYIGGAISSPEKPYTKVSFEKMAEENLNTPIEGGWEAMLEHYFLSAWVPPKNQVFNYYTQALSNDVYVLGMIGPVQTVAPDSNLTIAAKLYLGPEETDLLKKVAPNLDLTIDFGILWFISIAILWVMKQIYSVIGNWGWSIVLVTLFIKMAFFHLSAKSYRSMAVMRKLQPRLQSLKERYGDDRQKMTQATMELYKKEKVNPLSGCLPIVVQIPVFIALYWVLLESVELRQAPFILWIHDLSAKDPYFILPIIMGLTMLIQQRLNPPPPDPVQARMMQILPIFFTFLFINFPAGLVLYWVVNNTLSILQQWYITRSIENADKTKKIK